MPEPCLLSVYNSALPLLDRPSKSSCEAGLNERGKVSALLGAVLCRLGIPPILVTSSTEVCLQQVFVERSRLSTQANGGSYLQSSIN